VNVNLKKPPFLINGLSNSGKTTSICGLIKIGLTRQQYFAGFKPFDTGLMKRNASEQLSDGEIYLNHMTGEPTEGLVSPYMGHVTCTLFLAENKRKC